MGSRALMEPVVSMAGLKNSTPMVSGSTSASGSVRLLIRQSEQSPRARLLSGNVRASLPAEDPRRSAFGRGDVSSRSMRFDVRGQASKKTFSSFDDMLQNCGVPVLVDFYAVWCGPCQMMVPILNEVSKVLKDKVRVVKIDTEKYPDLASRFNIHALPTLVLFKNGQIADRVLMVIGAPHKMVKQPRTLTKCCNACADRPLTCVLRSTRVKGTDKLEHEGALRAEDLVIRIQKTL